MATEVIRGRSSWRTAATVFAIGWFFAAGGTIGLMAWMGLWTLVILAGLMALGVLVVAVRAARVRLEMEPDRLVVANHFRTVRVLRGDIVDVVALAWNNPLGESTTVGLALTKGDDVRIEALAVPAGDDEALDEWLDRLDDWRFRRSSRT